MSLELSSNKVLGSRPVSYKEIGLIFIGIIIIILIVFLIVHFFIKKRNDNKQSISTSSSASNATNSSNFAKLNYDRQMEELKNQTKNSSLNTPYVTSSNNILYQ